MLPSPGYGHASRKCVQEQSQLAQPCKSAEQLKSRRRPRAAIMTTAARRLATRWYARAHSHSRIQRKKVAVSFFIISSAASRFIVVRSSCASLPPTTVRGQSRSRLRRSNQRKHGRRVGYPWSRASLHLPLAQSQHLSPAKVPARRAKAKAAASSDLKALKQVTLKSQYWLMIHGQLSISQHL